MKISVPHNTTPADARKKVETLLERLASRYGEKLTEFDQHWENDLLVFRISAKGMKAKGTLEVTDREVVVDGKLPFLALPFASKIRSVIEREAQELFRTA